MFTVKDIQKRQDLQFIDLSQDIKIIKEYIGQEARDYDSFFIKIENGDYTEVYGMEGIIPYMNKFLYRIK